MNKVIDKKEVIHIYKYTLINGEVVKSELAPEKFNTKYKRLDVLRTIVEGNTSDMGLRVYRKIINALTRDLFTGIIRLTFSEKDFLSYYLDMDVLSRDDKRIVRSFL